jgi:hypothetical protein
MLSNSKINDKHFQMNEKGNLTFFHGNSKIVEGKELIETTIYSFL